MELLLPAIVIGLSFFLEFLVFSMLPNAIKQSKYLAAGALLLIMFAASSYVSVQVSLNSMLLAAVCAMRAVNVARVVAARMNPLELTRRYTRSALWLGAATVPLLATIYTDQNWNELGLLLWLSLAGSLVLLATTVTSVVRWRSKSSADAVKLASLPTVSVCIPARNETQDLPGCIESILRSTYPKLEVLVLDDCSHDKTPAIIKDYAHQGVRFIGGKEPAADWLAKNAAMNKLFNESKGAVVLFAGVDVRFEQNTVQRIIEQLDSDVDMVSIMPTRSGGHESSVFIQPLRYWWELCVPRFFTSRPPVLSTCWASKRSALKSIGSFESVKRSVQPEAHFAKRLRSKYAFILSGNRLGVTSIKGPREQYDTALRTRYPQTRRRPESLLFLIIAEITIFLTPLIGLYIGLFGDNTGYMTLSIASLSILVLCNVIISSLTVQKAWIIGFISLPFLLIVEWFILIRSMLAHEFGTVKWKERNICLPMLQVEKSLPEIDKK